MKMEKLIEMVKMNPALYDLTHEDYIKSKLKDDLWEKIAKELNTNGQSAKEQWRKLRECYREALRRQQKKSGQQAIYIKLWAYQKQMEFLKPFMKSRNPTAPPEESQLEENDPMSDEANDSETTEPFECVGPKRFKKSTTFEDSDKSENNRYETQRQEDFQNDALYQFFMSMFNITRGLPTKYQKEVRRKLFQAVCEAEDKADNEITIKCEFEQNSHMNSYLP